MMQLVIKLFKLNMFQRLLWRIVKILIVLLFVFIIIPVGYHILPSQQEYSYTARDNYSGIKSYIINLDKSKERYAKLEPLVADLGYDYQRLEAVYGANLSQKIIDELVDHERFRIMTARAQIKPAEVGCYLSHVKAWIDFLDSGYEYALIFEDDVSFDPPKLRSAIEDIVKRPNLWDLNLFNVPIRKYKTTIAHLNNGHTLQMYNGIVVFLGAYIVNRQAAERLLAHSFPIIMPVDLIYNRSWELGIKFTGVEDPILVNQTFGDTEIGDRTEKTEISFKERMIRTIIKWQTSLIRIMYNLKLYFTVYSEG